MKLPHIQTERLNLMLQSPEEARAQIDAMSLEDKAQLSADWLALFHGSTAANPWIHGFTLILRESGVVIGSAGFKGPPASDGIVEIAYGIAPDHQGMGYATETARALIHYAFQSLDVRLVRAHTLPEPNASTRVLTKCGFQHIGEVIDPEDGLVWRWEKLRETTSS